MRTNIAKTIIPAFVCLSCAYKIETYTNGTISGGEVRKVRGSMFAHVSSGEHYLEVSDKLFRHVRGREPFYLRIPEWHSILFITGKPGESATFHVVNLRSQVKYSISGGPAFFGWDLDPERAYGAIGTTYIGNVTSNIAVVVDSFPESECRVTLNLSASAVEHIEITKGEWNR